MDRAASIVLVLALAGCATFTPADKLYWGGAVADTVSTAAALGCGSESNPALTLAGDDTATVLASQVAVKYLFWRLFRRHQFVTGAVGGMQFAVAGHNARVAGGCP